MANAAGMACRLPTIMQSDTNGPGFFPRWGDEGEAGPVDDWHGPF